MQKDSPKYFSELIKKYAHTRARRAPLYNITFFLGAGFSKSWDRRCPVENELFCIPHDDSTRAQTHIDVFLQSLNYDTPLEISPALFKDIVYHLNMYKKYPAIRPRYIDDENIQLIENELSLLILEKFKTVIPLNYLDEAKRKVVIPYELNDVQRNMIAFFNLLLRRNKGDSHDGLGIRQNFITTNYDTIVEAIYDQLLGPDDSVFLYAYRGITPRSIAGIPNPALIHNHHLVFNLLKLNGGFEIIQHSDGYHFDYRRRGNEVSSHEAPLLVFPSLAQDYSHHYFQCIFPKAVRLMQESKILIIVGYSMPDEDALLRFLIRQFAEDISDAQGKHIFYVSTTSEQDQIDKLKLVFPALQHDSGLQVIPYSGDFSSWIEAALHEFN